MRASALWIFRNLHGRDFFNVYEQMSEIQSLLRTEPFVQKKSELHRQLVMCYNKLNANIFL